MTFPVLGLSLAVLLAGCASSNTTSTTTTTATAGTSGSAPAAVAIKGFAFDPSTLNVAKGTRVTWTNADPSAHTVTSDSGAFTSGNIAKDGTFSFVFDTPGTSKYHCSIHPSMTGTIVVS